MCAGLDGVGARPKIWGCNAEPKVKTSPFEAKTAKLVAEACREMTDEYMGKVDVGGEEEMSLSKEMKVWISSFADGAEKVSLGVKSVTSGVQPLEDLPRAPLSTKCEKPNDTRH